MLKVGFLGGGKMAQAMANGMISAGLLSSKNIIASAHESDEDSLQAFRSIGAKAVTTNPPVVENSDIIFVAVKPSVVPVVLSDVKCFSSGKLFISIAMGITLKEIEKILPQDSRVIRVMPNIPAVVQAACSVFVRGEKAKQEDVDIVQKLLQSIGTCDEISESLIDVVTAVSGSGPAMVFVLLEAIADGAVKMGVPRNLAYRLAAQTILGSGKLVMEKNEHPAILKDNVMSPAGSTASLIHHLEKNNFRASIIGSIEAATLRCKEISGNTK